MREVWVRFLLNVCMIANISSKEILVWDQDFESHCICYVMSRPLLCYVSIHTYRYKYDLLERVGIGHLLVFTDHIFLWPRFIVSCYSKLQPLGN